MAHRSLTKRKSGLFHTFLRLSQLSSHVAKLATPTFNHFSGEKVDRKILQSDWPSAFWPISQETGFSQMQDLCGDTANNKNFH